MNYIDWTERVALAFAHLDKPSGQASMSDIADALGLAVPAGPARDAEAEATWNALRDLSELGILGALNTIQITETENTRKIRAGVPLRTVWPAFFDDFLEPEQEAFLRALVQVAEVEEETWADLAWTNAAEVFRALGWPTEGDMAINRGFRVQNILSEHGFLQSRLAMGSLSAFSIRPTYKGAVRATQQVATEWQTRLAEMAVEGETSTVEFKVELKLGTDRQKAEFIKDVLGLATTKASGPKRHLIIGYDDESLVLIKPVDPALSQDHLEDVLNAYCSPAPTIRYFRVPMGGGTVAGVVEVTRDAASIPYRVGKAIWKLAVGDVFVRHGTHTENPSPAEQAALEAEGERARTLG